MSGSELLLSASGLKRVPPSDPSLPFCFVVGGQRYHCSVLTATFLSGRIAGHLMTDPTLRDYQVTTPDCSHCFQQFLMLGKGFSVPLTRANHLAFLQLSEELENRELYSLITNFLDSLSEKWTDDSDPSLKDWLRRFRDRFALNLDVSHEARFIASNLSSYSSDDLRSLSVDALAMVLSNENIKVETEDWLCRLLLQLDKPFFPLFEFVHFTFVSLPVLAKFWEIYVPCLDCLNLTLWKTIGSRFLLADGSRTLRFSSETPGWLNGIVRFLGQRMSVDASSVHDGSGWSMICCKASNASNLDDPDHYFISRTDPHQWLLLDFHEMRVRPSSYTIQTQPWNAGCCHLRSWVFEGSLDREQWTVLDERKDNDQLNGKSQLANFTLTRGTMDCRYVRIRMTDINHQKAWYLVVAGFEVFGDLIGDAPHARWREETGFHQRTFK
jgi:hypothetical protein